jgi:uncharacterized protein
MGERTSYEPGTFSWVELHTTDREVAKAFYGRIFGWEAEDAPAGEGMTYTMASLDGRYVGGMTDLRPDLREQGVPPHWLSYVTVDDADRTAERAHELGAEVAAGPFDVMGAGRMAVIRDPLGGPLALWQAYDHPGAGVVNEPGALCWNDLVTSHREASARFYRELFGWRIDDVADGAYWAIYNGERSNGGLVPLEGMPQVWNAYFAADDLDAKIEAIKGEGGALHVGPREVPAGRFAVVGDPQRAVFCLIEGELDP